MLGAPPQQTFAVRRQTIAERKYLLCAPHAGGDQILELLKRGRYEISVKLSQRLSIAPARRLQRPEFSRHALAQRAQFVESDLDFFVGIHPQVVIQARAIGCEAAIRLHSHRQTWRSISSSVFGPGDRQKQTQSGCTGF